MSTSHSTTPDRSAQLDAELDFEHRQSARRRRRKDAERITDLEQRLERMERMLAMPPARGGFDRTATQGPGDVEVPMPGLLEEEEPAEEPQESGQAGGERYLTAGSIDPHTGIGRLPKVGRDYSSPGDAPRFCGFLVVDLDGYSDDGLPNSLITPNGEHAPLRPRNRKPGDDAWWSVRDDTDASGYRWILNFTREQLVEVRNGGFALARETSALSMAGAWRQSHLKQLRGQALEAGCCEKRWDKAVEIISHGGLEEARQKYGSSPSSCSCPDAQSGRSKACKHRIAWTIAEKLQWDPTIVYDAAKWIAPAEQLTEERGQEMAAQIRRERSRLPESMVGYNPGINGEMVAKAVPA